MKRIFSILCLLMVSAAIMAQQPQLTFNNEKKFKIVQFTDIHLQQKKTKEYAKVIQRIENLVKWEKPDLLVFTGDMITSKEARELLGKFIKDLDRQHIPWCVVYGNHDAEQDLTRAEMSQMIVGGKYTLNTLNNKGELADMELPIHSSNDAAKNAYYLYCMDSNDYSTVKGLGGYGWFTTQQVTWLRNACLARTDTAGNVAPSMAFFHIPLVEYVDACSPALYPRKSDGKQYNGIRGESICCGSLNTGMFAAMKETRSIVATFAGHDHDNDYVGLHKGIALCYGRFSGGYTTYCHLPSGARVISITEGTRDFETWIRDDDARTIRHLLVTSKQLTEK